MIFALAAGKVIAEASRIKMRQSATVAPVADCCMEETDRWLGYG
jgi:hypothetical protein